MGPKKSGIVDMCSSDVMLIFCITYIVDLTMQALNVYFPYLFRCSTILVSLRSFRGIGPKKHEFLTCSALI